MVTEHHQGLRFDIYERVHLTEGLTGIKELDEVELVPHIQVLPQGEQAVLRGNLLLSGKYVDEHNTENRSLEHLIPVEITLPMNRIGRMEDISVEIENFDVDLLSSRSLNVTGVLSLNGLEVAATENDSLHRAEEEVVFVHEAEEHRHEEPSDSAIQAGRDHMRQETVEPPSPFFQTNAAEAQHSGRTPAAEEIAEETETTSASVQEREELAAPIIEEKKEMKIAFGSKQTQEAADSEATGLKSLIHSAASPIGNAAQQKEKPEPEAKDASHSSDALEWKKLLLSSISEQQEFRKLRVCIVQKDETLETIAKRYELNPREIALFNRLGEQELKAGQIIYIPKTS
jgi:stage VI sporulation protein D